MRDERRLSARELSLRAGLSESYVGKLEAGKIDPSLRAFGQLAVALGLTCAEIHFLVLEAARSTETVTGAE
jgi:predicted transcriptional regulator